jgi:adenylyl-sulfate kinase
MNTFVLWLTGLPASGKSNLADSLAIELSNLGFYPETINSGRLRRTPLGGSLGFSQRDREQNIRRHALAAQLLMQNHMIPVVSAVSPYQADRKLIRTELKNFIEIYVSTPANHCQKQDQTGNWAKALQGEIKNFTGVSAPYEVPQNPECTTDLSLETIEEATRRIIRFLFQEDWLLDSGNSPTEIEELTQKLKKFGYL